MINYKKNEQNLNGLTFIDLFAGLGGFRLALESLGAKCVYSNEWEKKFNRFTIQILTIYQKETSQR